tara:strand:+ start:389 stop:544 length:156 start_codon:yes stop_codon:yes gene_type:complete
MFYEVRVYDSNNHIKKVIPTKELSRRHWMGFEEEQAKYVSPQIKKKKNQNN